MHTNQKQDVNMNMMRIMTMNKHMNMTKNLNMLNTTEIISNYKNENVQNK